MTKSYKNQDHILNTLKGHTRCLMAKLPALNKKGMTLIEIMIVLAIIAGIGTVVLNMATTALKKSKVKNTRILINEIGKSLELYYTDCGKYPSDLKALLQDPGDCPHWGPESYFGKKKKVPKDSWNNELVYESDEGSYELISLGADGKEGGKGYGKDISSEEEA